MRGAPDMITNSPLAYEIGNCRRRPTKTFGFAIDALNVTFATVSGERRIQLQ
jgi:hypothetical protein